jgi:uncharacterized protein (TIGR02466 family)
MSEAAVRRAEQLMAEGRAEEALALTAELVSATHPSHIALAGHAAALKAAGRLDEALPFNRQATERYASSPIAWHNLAATLGDLGQAREAVAACEQAFRLNLDAPETWSVYARALLAAGDAPRAEYAYRQSLMRTGGDVVVAGELADLIWMLRGDVAEADSILDLSFQQGGPPTPLLLAKATLYEAAGDEARAVALLEAASQQLPDDIPILMSAAQAALRRGRPDEADRYVRLAEAVAPNARNVIQHRAIVALATGRAEQALEGLKSALALHPDDQSLWGWAVTAARAVGDPLYASLSDYDAVVGAYDLQTPAGWSSLEEFLSDLRNSLNNIHLYSQHPTGQSLRNGSQTMHLLSGSDDPVVQAFFRAIDAPIRAHMAKIGHGEDALRRRNTGDYRIAGAWSVRLKPNGYHRDHFHPEGWLSSAFYVETPDAALESPEREGWIRFGQPPFAADPPLPAAHYVKPKPGRLVLFPSYMWHGTVPFTTDESRMTIAFDAVPK